MTTLYIFKIYFLNHENNPHLSGFYGEAIPHDSGLVVVVKSHGHTTGKGDDMTREEQKGQNHIAELNGTAVIVVRNPFKAIIGHRHLDEGGHTGYAKRDRFAGNGWDSFVRKKIADWENFYLDWLHSPSTRRIMVVHFEHLSVLKESTLRAAVAFLGLQVDDKRLCCAIEQSEGEFHRKRWKGVEVQQREEEAFDPFSAAQRAMVRDAIVRVDKAMKAAGHGALPTAQYEFMTSPNP
jgi:hypothetical protein